MNPSLDQLRSAYARFEPEGTDAWNPLRNDLELWHRVRLLLELTTALRHLRQPPGSLRVLDVGCGVGRSSRLLLELGIMPENVLAIDLRPDVLVLARRLNPALRYRALADWDEWPTESFDLCLQCTAFSSLPGAETRARAAHLMAQSAGPAGQIYWWDALQAHDFAGGEALDPRTLFSDRDVLSDRRVGLRPTWAEAAASSSWGGRIVRRLGEGLPRRATHQSILFGGIRR